MTIFYSTVIPLLVNGGPTCMLWLMSLETPIANPELPYVRLPRVIVALDTNVEHALEVLGSIDIYTPQEVGVQIRDSLLRVCGNELIRIAGGRGRFVVANSQIADAPAKQVIDITNWAITENPLTQDKIYKPDAITVAPPVSTSAAVLKEAVEHARSNGLAVIGTPLVHMHHETDVDWIGDEAVKAGMCAELAEFNALEVVYGALKYFKEYRKDSIEQIVVSKISPYETDLREAARTAYGLGGTSLLLGESIVGVINPREPIDGILGVTQKAF